MSQRHYVLCLCLALMAGGALRFWGIGEKSLWLDEIMTVQKASGSFSEMMGQIRQHDAHPPLFQIVEWLWLRLDRGDGYARVPSAVFGLLGVWLAGAIGRRLFGRGAGAAAAGVTALSYFQVYFSQEARLYSLVMTLFLGQVWVLLRILSARGRAGWGWWGAYGLLGLASLYTYALCVLTAGALAAAYLWHTGRGVLTGGRVGGAGRRPQWGTFLGVHAGMGLLFLPWGAVLMERTAMLRRTLGANAAGAGLPSARELIEGVAAWGIGPQEFGAGSLMGALLGAALVLAAGVCAADRRARRPAALLGALFLLPLAGYLILPMPRVHQYDPKHLAFLQPLLLIALCGARRSVSAARRGGLAPTVYMAAALGALNLFGLTGYWGAEGEKENWRAAARSVAEGWRAGDVALFTPDYVGYAFRYYAGEGYATAGATPLARGEEVSPEFKRVWVVSCRSPVAQPLPVGEALARQGWQAERGVTLPGRVGTIQVTEFVRAMR